MGESIPLSSLPTEIPNASKYHEIWDKAETLLEGHALPVVFDTVTDAKRFRGSVKMNQRGEAFEVKRQGTTVYLWKKGGRHAPKTA